MIVFKFSLYFFYSIRITFGLLKKSNRDSINSLLKYLTIFFETAPNLLQNVTIKLATKFANEWLSTGYYLPAGVGMKLRINEEESSLISEWSVRVGSHSDDLSKLDTLERWPCISQTRYLMKPEMTIYSPYGGLVYFQSSYTNVKIEAEISNVVESPYFDLTLPETVNDW